MRTIWAMRLAAPVVAALALPSAAGATSVPPFKGNDTGGIIAYSLYQQGVDVKALAFDHCASYGKVAKLLGVQAEYGGYISFECIWLPPGHLGRPLRAAY